MEERMASPSFRQPDLLQMTEASSGPLKSKRNAQLDLPGYSYPRPENQLKFPEQNRNAIEVIFPSEVSPLEKLENPSRETRLQGNLVFKQNNKTMTGVDALEALNTFLESDRGTELLEQAAREASLKDRKDDISATPRSFNVGSPSRSVQSVTANPITITGTTAGSIRLIQPIQIVTTSRPQFRTTPRAQFNSSPRNSFRNNPSSRPSPRPQTSSFNSFLSSPNSNRNSPSQRPRIPKQQPPALTFVDNGLVAVLGRQVAGKPVEGFPNGLPALTPLGVRITLENMFGPNGEMVMNAIPGEAGVDYATYNSVPDTGFSCSDQDYPGIFSDTGSQCQAFYMCQPNGEANAFLCPNGTMFNQQYFICDWWYNLDCDQQPSFYNLNQLIYETPEEGKVYNSLFGKDD